MQKHLKKIAQILDRFRKKHKFIGAYLECEGCVNKNVHTRLNISCGSEFDKLTLEQINTIQRNIYEEIRSYLEKNNINKNLYITTEKRSWATSNFLLYFRDEYVLSVV